MRQACFRTRAAYSFLVLFLSFASFSICTACSPLAKNRESAETGYLFTLVMLRLDKQNDIYYKFGSLAEQLASDPSNQELIYEFKGFTAGIQILSQNELVRGAIEILYEENKDLMDTFNDISGSNIIKFDKFRSLSSDELAQLSGIFYQLGDCCDRGITQTFAYYLNNQETEHDVIQGPLDDVNDLLFELTVLMR